MGSNNAHRQTRVTITAKFFNDKLKPPRLHLSGFLFVPGQGFEPRFRDPKSLVLPLDDPGVPLVLAKTPFNTRDEEKPL